MEKEILQDGTGNYLQVHGIVGESYSDKIFSYQDISGFLPLEIRKINGKKEYIYNISGKLSLEQYVSGNCPGLPEIKKVFEHIFSLMRTTEEYLLDSRGIVLDSDCVFIDPLTGEVGCIYQMDEEKNVVREIGRLLEDVMEKMNQRDKELVFFVYGMHKLTKEAGCTCALLEKYLHGQGSELALSKEDERPIPKERQEFVPANLKMPEKTVHYSHYAAPVGILVGSILIYLVLWGMNLFQKPVSGEIDYSKVVGTFFFFAAVAGYGVWKTMPGKQREKNVLYHDEEKDKKKVCLIPQRGSDAPVAIPYFPFSLGRLRILQEAGSILIMDEESDTGTYYNGRRLAPWSRTEIQDGDILQISEKSYVVEITMSHIII